MWLTILLSAALTGVGMGAGLMSTPLEKDSWALLVAGSKGYHNYRHQADVSHAYQVMLAEGIPASRIIVMMYDDIAFHKENPKPGVITNSPNGTNVYEGVNIDYRGKDVNSRNFLRVLRGDKAAVNGIGNGRVIESDENTNVFVYFSDHGGPGLLCFPDDVLYAVQLEDVLTWMYENKRYNKLIMYIEACYSGSMFDNILPENTNVFVMTAAARDESSFGVYCNEGICMGDEFSVRWMERMDADRRGDFETFFHQYQTIRTSVKKSHVQLYGDLSVGNEAMTPNEDAGHSRMYQLRMWEESYVHGYSKSASRHAKFSLDTAYNKVFSLDSKDIPLYSLMFKVTKSNETAVPKAKMDVNKLIQGRRVIHELMENLVSLATADEPQLRSAISNMRLGLSKEMFPCYMELLDQFRKHCFGHEHEYLIHQYHKLANICVLHLDTSKLLYQLPALCFPYKTAVRIAVL